MSVGEEYLASCLYFLRWLDEVAQDGWIMPLLSLHFHDWFSILEREI